MSTRSTSMSTLTDEPTVAMTSDDCTRSVTEPSGPVVERDIEIGTTVGRYVLLERVGAGGMGVVYAAYDPRLDRKVAVKFVRAQPDARDGDDSEMASARLQREAQAMAKLSHTNVVTVFDAGLYEGQVFIAMEFLVGATLKAWLKEESRSLLDILRVMIDAGRGLAAAHEQNMVHRDFKPDNVIVTDKGRVAVMDFGLVHYHADAPPRVQKAERRSAPKPVLPLHGSSLLTEELTSHGTIMGTLAYMSPEQQRGDLVDARGDQFSYCVALYEALYGVRPFAGSDLDTLAEAIAHRRFQEPKRRLGPRRLLDVVKRGLSSDPAGRFPSMSDLLLELERIRAPKRRVVALAVGLAVAASVTTLGIANQATSVENRCDRTGDEWATVWNAQAGEQLSRAFASTKIAYAPAAAQKVRAIFDEYGQRWQAMHASSCEDTKLRGIQSEKLMDLRAGCLGRRLSEVRSLLREFAEPDAQTVRHALGAVYGIGRLEDCADAQALLHDTSEPKDEATKVAVEALRAELDGAMAAHHTGHYKQAKERIDALVPRVEALEYLPLLAEVLGARGYVEDGLAQFDESHRSSLRAMLVAESAGADKIALMASSHLVFVDFERGELDDAEMWREHTNAIIKRIDAGPAERATAKLNAMGLAFAREDLDTAATLALDAIELYGQAYTELRPEVATTYSNLGVVRNYQGRRHEAIEATETALAQRIELFGDYHPETAVTYLNLSGDLETLGEYGLAYRYLRRSNEIWKDVDPQHYYVGVTSSGLAMLEATRGRWLEADRLSQLGLDVLQASAAPDNYNLVPSWRARGVVLLNLGRIDEAESALSHLMEIHERSKSTDAAARLYARLAMTAVAEARGELEAAYEQRVAIYRDAQEQLGANDPRMSNFAADLAHVARQTGRLAETETYVLEALELLGNAGDTPNMASLILAYSEVLWALGKPGPAREALDRAWDLVDREWASEALLGRFYFTEARLLWEHDPETAREHAAQAAGWFERSEAAASWDEHEFYRWFAALPG